MVFFGLGGARFLQFGQRLRARKKVQNQIVVGEVCLHWCRVSSINMFMSYLYCVHPREERAPKKEKKITGSHVRMREDKRKNRKRIESNQRTKKCKAKQAKCKKARGPLSVSWIGASGVNKRVLGKTKCLL